MIWIAIAYLYVAGLPLAAQVATEGSGGINIRTATFIILWPVVVPLLYAASFISAVLLP